MDNKPLSEDKLLTPEEVCDLLDVSRQTLWRMLRDKTFPAPVIVGASAKRWPPKVVDRWISSELAAANDEGTAPSQRARRG